MPKKKRESPKPNFSTVRDGERKGKIHFFIVHKDYQIGDKVETEGRPLAYSVHMREGGYVNIHYDKTEKSMKILSWSDEDDPHFSVIYDSDGNQNYPSVEGTNSYFIPKQEEESFEESIDGIKP